MMNPVEIEQRYQEYMGALNDYVPDGVLEVDLALLQNLGLLSELEKLEGEEASLSHSFYVVESQEKLTLFNQRFLVWIVPQLINHIPTTYTLVALNSSDQPHLEMVFSTTGVYNHSGLVLRILEKFLQQIEETEEEIDKFEDKDPTPQE
ncbi:MAG: hypothetical protein KDK55_04505 [Chlamydiia bacterium]|nr:hypothetical protein [Chlamydiia bacterium]